MNFGLVFLLGWSNKTLLKFFFQEEYVEYNSGWNGGLFYLNIDYEQEYRIQYGESYSEITIKNGSANINEIKDFFEIMYERWIKAEMHYAFTIETNKRFDKFQLPYKLS